MSLRLVDHELTSDIYITEIRLHLTDDPGQGGECRLPRDTAISVIRSIAMASGIDVEIIGFND